MNITDRIQITNEDNMQLMGRYPDNYFDLAIVDPPYGIDINKAGWIKQKKQNKPHTDKNWDSEIPPIEYFIELFRVSKEQIIWGGNYFTKFLPPSR
jgi:site-specific DNA-methyltransferase (adenine-specific)